MTVPHDHFRKPREISPVEERYVDTCAWCSRRVPDGYELCDDCQARKDEQDREKADADLQKQRLEFSRFLKDLAASSWEVK